MIKFTENQTAILLRLLEKRTLSCDGAGHYLKKRKLLKQCMQGYCNLCLPGGAVLRSLNKLGLVSSFPSGRDQWSHKVYCLTESGETAAKSLQDTTVVGVAE